MTDISDDLVGGHPILGATHNPSLKCMIYTLILNNHQYNYKFCPRTFYPARTFVLTVKFCHHTG